MGGLGSRVVGVGGGLGVHYNDPPRRAIPRGHWLLVRLAEAELFQVDVDFNLVKPFLSRIIHLHDLHDPKYAYQLMVDLLVKARWQFQRDDP
jgi:hypothetical protein